MSSFVSYNSEKQDKHMHGLIEALARGEISAKSVDLLPGLREGLRLSLEFGFLTFECLSTTLFLLGLLVFNLITVSDLLAVTCLFVWLIKSGFRLFWLPNAETKQKPKDIQLLLKSSKQSETDSETASVNSNSNSKR